MLTARIHAAGPTRTVFGELQIRSLLDNPALRDSVGSGRMERPERPANIRRLLENAAA